MLVGMAQVTTVTMNRKCWLLDAMLVVQHTQTHAELKWNGSEYDSIVGYHSIVYWVCIAQRPMALGTRRLAPGAADQGQHAVSQAQGQVGDSRQGSVTDSDPG